MSIHSLHIILDEKEYQILNSLKGSKAWKNFIFDMVKKAEELNLLKKPVKR